MTTPTTPLITAEELDLILDDTKQMWTALCEVAQQVPGAAATIVPRTELPAVIGMVFDQAKQAITSSEIPDMAREAAMIRDAARYRFLRDCTKFVEIITMADQMFRVSGGKNLDGVVDEAARP